MKIRNLTRGFTRGIALSLVAVGIVFPLAIAPAFAVTNGTPDTDYIYSNVGMIILEGPDGTRSRYCSAVLIHERVVHTAAHCSQGLEGLIEAGWTIYVTFESHPSLGNWQEVSAVHTHTEWKGHFAPSSIDLGALVLAVPYVGATPATFPSVGYLDGLKDSGALEQGVNATQFTRVGYGFTLAWPPPVFLGNITRQFTNGDYSGLMKQWISLHSNPAQDDGAACFWDSGGAVFYDDADANRIFVGSPSWIDAKCIAMSLNTRTDTQEYHDFFNGIINGLN